MADHEEYRIRSERLKTNPFFKNYKEGVWESPNGTKRIKTVVSYEAEMINLSPVGSDWATSIYPILWDELFSEWKYLGPK